MKSAAVFRAAKMVDIKAVALLHVSDVPFTEKTLFHGSGDEAERSYRRFVQWEVMSRIIAEVLSGST